MASVGYVILVATSLGAIISSGENEEERVARDVAAKEEQARKLREQAAALESQIATLKTTRCSLGREALFGLVDRDAVKKQRSAWRSQPSVVTWTQDMRRNRTSAESAETARKALRDELLAKLEATWAEVRQVTSALNPDTLDQAAIAAMERQAQNRKIASAAFSQLVQDVSVRAEEISESIAESLPLPEASFQGMCAPDLNGEEEREHEETPEAPPRASAMRQAAEVLSTRVTSLLRDDDPRHIANRQAVAEFAVEVMGKAGTLVTSTFKAVNASRAAGVAAKEEEECKEEEQARDLGEEGKTKAEGWQTVRSQTTGRQYYFHPESGESRWEPPNDANVATDRTSAADKVFDTFATIAAVLPPLHIGGNLGSIKLADTGDLRMSTASKEEVALWLQDNDLEHLQEKFRAANVDGTHILKRTVFRDFM